MTAIGGMPTTVTGARKPPQPPQSSDPLSRPWRAQPRLHRPVHTVQMAGLPGHLRKALQDCGRRPLGHWLQRCLRTPGRPLPATSSPCSLQNGRKRMALAIHRVLWQATVRMGLVVCTLGMAAWSPRLRKETRRRPCLLQGYRTRGPPQGKQWAKTERSIQV